MKKYSSNVYFYKNENIKASNKHPYAPYIVKRDVNGKTHYEVHIAYKGTHNGVNYADAAKVLVNYTVGQKPHREDGHGGLRYWWLSKAAYTNFAKKLNDKKPLDFGFKSRYGRDAIYNYILNNKDELGYTDFKKTRDPRTYNFHIK